MQIISSVVGDLVQRSGGLRPAKLLSGGIRQKKRRETITADCLISELSPKKLEKLIVHFWKRMGQIYGHKWTSSYGDALGSRGLLADTAKFWADSLRGITTEQLARGVNTCREAEEEWPPTLNKFRNICLGQNTEPHGTHAAAYREYNPRALARPAPDREKGREALRGLREALGEKEKESKLQSFTNQFQEVNSPMARRKTAKTQALPTEETRELPSVDPELETLIPPLTDDEFNQLEALIVKEGCRDPLVTWEGTLLDGHNRLRICGKHDLPFQTVEAKGISSREEAINWIIDNQLGRRNLNPAQASYLRGLQYNREKADHGGDRRSDKTSRGQNDPLKTSEKLAETHGVSPPTIRRDGKFAKAIDAIAENVGAKFKRQVLSGESPFTRKEIVEIAKLPPDEQKKAVRQKKKENRKPHVTNNSGENEWYTPPEYLEAARGVMGGIDTDPASNEQANENVKAAKYYTKEDNGLEQPWDGNVWLNPPYAQPLVADFSKAVVDKHRAGEFKQACVFINNATDTVWFQSMLEVASAVCFIKGRVKFVDKDGNPSGAPLQGQAMLYLGKNVRRFARIFSEFGAVLTPYSKNSG